MTVIDRRYSVAEGQAVKAPCAAATTANVTLAGQQTIDGVSLTETSPPMRVLVKNQSTASQNGIYDVSTGNWTRARDFDGAYDVVTGTRVFVTGGSVNGSAEFVLTTAGTITIDSTSLTFANYITLVVPEAHDIGYLPNVGSGSRTIGEKLDEVVSLIDFGVVDDAVTDNTAAFQAALNAIALLGGGKLEIPAAKNGYVVNGPCTYTGRYLRIQGSGPQSVIIKPTTTGDLFVFSGLQHIQVDAIRIEGGTSASAGAFVHFTSTNIVAGNHRVTNCIFNGGYDHVIFAGGQNVEISSCILRNATHTFIWYGASFAGIAIVSNLTINGIPTGPGTNIGYGIRIESGDTFIFSNLNIAFVDTGIYAAAASSAFVKNIHATNVLCDQTLTGPGWYLSGAASLSTMCRVKLTNCWAGGNGLDGYVLESVSEVTMSACNAVDNLRYGIRITGNNEGIKIIGCTVEGNSTSSSGTYDGIHVEAGTNDFQLIGNRIGQTSTADVTNSQKYGVNFSAGTVDQLTMNCNDLRVNVTAGLHAVPAGSGNIIADNNGYNPVGGSTITVGASPFSYTAGPSPETVYVRSGTVSQVAVNGAVAFVATGCTIPLGPNEVMTVTYSGAPTMTKYVH